MKVYLAGRVAAESDRVVIDERRFPGRQGRLLFAYLVVGQGRPIPRDELAEVLWEGSPPATWEKALGVLASKLRGLLGENRVHEPITLTAAFGCYRLDLPEGSWVDVVAAEQAADEAEAALARGDIEGTKRQAALAESLVRGSFLPGDDGGWVEEKRRELAGVRAHALSALAEACLRSGEPQESVRWAEQAIEAEPFRESGYRRLMAAHVAAGNRAEALQVYERCRHLLAEELGTYPSPETEVIYRRLLDASAGGREVEALDAMSSNGAAAARTHRRTRPALAVAAVVALVAVMAAGTAIAVMVTRGNGTGAPSAAEMPRIALVVPRLSLGDDDSSVAPYVAALEHARSADGVQTQTFAIDPARRGLPRRVRENIGSFGLVLLAGPLVGTRFVHVMAQHPHTRFVVIDPPDSFTNDTPLYRAVSGDANATDVFFATGPTAYLAGYLSALMGRRRGPGKRQTVVSIIASDPALNQNEFQGFAAGVAAVDTGIAVPVNYTHDASDPAVCARIANRQIDEGSTTVYADAGTCSAGALSVAADRGVWAVGSDPSSRGSEILASTVKSLGAAADSVITSYLEGALPRHHFDIGIERGAIALTNLNQAIPARIRTDLARVTSQNMPIWKAYATPQK